MPAYDDRLFSPAAPVVYAKLFNRQTGKTQSEIPMLMDSGADVTLLPKSAVDSLEVERSGPNYELIAFDGAKCASEAEHTELIFWGGPSGDNSLSSTKKSAFLVATS